jgi:ribosomal protein S18 acetylase RimI-like enzyme
MITIRNINIQDKQQIYSLIDAVNEHDQLGYSLTDEWFDYVIEEAGEHIFVVVNSLVESEAANTSSILINEYKDIVGLATCMIDHIGKQMAQINIIVHPEYRNQGIGTLLYNQIIEHLASYTADNTDVDSTDSNVDNYGTDNYAIVNLEVIVKKRLINSLRFVEKRGFTPNLFIWELEKELVTKDAGNKDIYSMDNINNIVGNYSLRLAHELSSETNCENTSKADGKTDNRIDIEEYINMMESTFGHQVDEEYYIQTFADPSIKLYFFWNQSDVIGMISIQLRDNISTGYLFDIAIKEQYRGQGLGRLMICQALDIIKQHNMQRASLVVDGTNQKAFSLYEKLGFQVVDEDIIMVKCYDILNT